MSTVHVVTTGDYSDYRISGLFENKATAERIRDQLNADSPYAHADVEEFQLNGPDFVAGRSMTLWTYVSGTGDVYSTDERSDLDILGACTGKCTTQLVRPRTAPDSYTVHTHGDAHRVPQAHADAVAKLRAELMGL